MPIYIYGCENCGRTYEFLLSTSEVSDARLCPNCGATLKKLPHYRFVSINTSSLAQFKNVCLHKLLQPTPETAPLLEPVSRPLKYKENL